MEQYTNPNVENHCSNPKQESLALRSGFRKIRELVPIADYAATLTKLRLNRQGLRGRCPVHSGDNPSSFSVDTEKGLFNCFSCGSGGDVIDLYRAVEGGEPWEAMLGLSIAYGVELPGRSKNWHDRQPEKADAREIVRDRLIDVIVRRFTKIYAPLLDEVCIDQGEYENEVRELARRLRPLAYRIATRRVYGD